MKTLRTLLALAFASVLATSAAFAEGDKKCDAKPEKSACCAVEKSEKSGCCEAKKACCDSKSEKKSEKKSGKKKSAKK